MNKQLLYAEVAYDIKKDIFNGVYDLDDYIPTEIELEKKYGVSKITIRRAVDILCQEGYLEKKSGKGTKVISNRTFNKLSKASSFTYYLENIGKTLKKEVISVEVIPNPNIIEEQKSMGEKVVKFVRLYYLDDEPYIFFTYYLPYFDGYEKLNEEDISLYNWLRDKGVLIYNIKDSFKVGELDEEGKKLLKMTKPTVLERHRQSYDNLNRLVELSIAYYNSDKQEYEIQYEV
ncbi:GntR family transcriptional regulator [Miniphocaeibacter halophilus]|uniref:GntR family transcriptional regulator n=1 Tax=Miniphocaeibacter halophilus TaxID=2931922 RepID=A0AC61MZR0_9FIRM|nr:GntR family transcriptional regulator [Miniphocaeibacter halophilus]QQK08381.1 GntR family transcriptional regulator [Miniphocaeibacter halophilus]